VAWNTSDLHWVAVLLGPTPPASSRNSDTSPKRDSLLPPPSRAGQVAPTKAPSEAM
jgi:hypothetical protein